MLRAMNLRFHSRASAPAELHGGGRFVLPQKDFVPAWAIVTGILDERKVDPELLQTLERHIAFYRQQLREELETPASDAANHGQSSGARTHGD